MQSKELKFNGYQAGGGLSDPLDKLLYTRYLKKGSSFAKTIIECGANDGLYLSTCKVFEEIGWDCINIEASIKNYSRLIVNRPKSRNIFCALSNTDGDVLEMLCSETLNGCLDNFTSLNGFGDKPVSKTTVCTARYDSLIQEPILLFVLDVEGGELKAIEGMRNTEFWPLILCVEHPNCGLENIKQSLIENYDLDWNDSLDAVFVQRNL
jgi:FkbM family methyltransferase